MCQGQSKNSSVQKTARFSGSRGFFERLKNGKSQSPHPYKAKVVAPQLHAHALVSATLKTERLAFAQGARFSERLELDVDYGTVMVTVEVVWPDALVA